MDVVPFRCRECGLAFAETAGGICRECGRLLCRSHLRLEKDGPICDACKSVDTAASAPITVTDAERDRVVELVMRDVVATLGAVHSVVVRACADRARQFEPDLNHYPERLVNEVQQRFHDERIDTTWPHCPQHANHPLFFVDGWWRCPRDNASIARLGQLDNLQDMTQDS